MALSAGARLILEQMEPNRGYGARELRAFAPDMTLEDLHDVMRELWVHRQVERTGYAGWRRERSSAPATTGTAASSRLTSRAGDADSRSNKRVRPEDLFDHSAFEDIFK